MVKNLVILACASSLFLTGCSKQIDTYSKSLSNNLFTLSSDAEKTVVDGAIKFKFINFNGHKASRLGISATSLKGKQFLKALPQSDDHASNISSNQSTQFINASLLVAFPIGLLGEQNIFGGVITKVSDKTSTDLGGLKLTDLPPIHVKPLITGAGTDKPAMTLVGCTKDCNEDSDPEAVISFPIVGILESEQMVVIDLSAVGKELDLVTMLDPDGDYTGLKAVSSTTTTMDYSVSTLIFDVNTKMIPKEKEVTDNSAPVTEFVVRWYLKLNSASDPSFKSRSQTNGVGFFTTSRSEDTKITRFSHTNNGTNGVKYFIKNVPPEHRKSFSKAFDSWNAKFTSIIGRPLLTYEFIEKEDPRYNDLVPGDIRFNIIEWDLDNKAGYGGLGPSVANQFSGETLSGNILIQGPTIIELYTAWFKTSKTVGALISQGKSQEAHDLLVSFNKEADKLIQARTKRKFSLKLGKKLDFTIQAQRPELEDPMTKGSFDMVPADQTFETYMDGYFQEMLAHEMGHNLGLRHNFRGNLGDDGSRTEGSTSRSIMEYLGRNFRYLNRISDYDVMAISYGYKGVVPNHFDWFCTDEDVAYEDADLTRVSAECTKDDATNDPFSFFQGMLKRSVSLIVAPETTQGPLWKTEEIKTKIETAIKGLEGYALSAETTSKNWTNFFGKLDRPEDASGVKPYVIGKIKDQLCDKKIIDAINRKESEEAKILAMANMQSFTKVITESLVRVNAANEQSLKCE